MMYHYGKSMLCGVNFGDPSAVFDVQQFYNVSSLWTHVLR